MVLEHSPRTTRSGRQIGPEEQVQQDPQSPRNLENEAMDQQNEVEEEDVQFLGAAGDNEVSEAYGDVNPNVEQGEAEPQRHQILQPSSALPDPSALPAPPAPHGSSARQVAVIQKSASSVNAKICELSEKMQSMIVQTPREVPKFDGKVDGTDWIKNFNRTAAFNGHSDEQKLRAVAFGLTGAAADWFDNVGDQCTNWTEFDAAFRKRFVNAVRRSEEAREKLGRLVFSNGISYTAHLETVIKLCRQVEPRMTEEEIIRRYVRTFSKTEAAIILGRSMKTVEELREHAANLDETLPFVNKREDSPTLNAIARSRSPARARSPSRHVSWAESRPVSRSRSAGRAGSMERSETSQSQPMVVPTGQYRPRVPTFFMGNRRTEAGEPICNHCNRVGHIMRHCRDRERGLPAVQPKSQDQGN